MNDRYAKNMKWSDRVRPTWGWGIQIKLWCILMLKVKQIFAWYHWKEFYKNQSLKIIKKGNRQWLSLIHCNVKEFCKTLHAWNYLNVWAAMSRQ